MAFKGHFLWISSDLKNGLEIWRSDDVMVANSDDTPDGQTTTSNGETTATGVTEDPGEGLTNSSQTNPQNNTGQQDGRSSDESAPEDNHGISGGWIALIAVLAAVAVAGLVATAYLLGRARHPCSHSSSHPASQPATPAGTPPAKAGEAQAPPAQAEETQTGPQYCSGCGAPLNPSAQFCAECGRRIGD